MSSLWNLRRSVDDTKVAGLCGGLARHWGIDPVLVRLGCVLLALSGGIGVLLYVAGWLLVPREGQATSLLQERLGEQIRNWPREVWMILAAVVSLVALGVLGSISPFGFGPAFVLALIWYFGFYRRRPRPTGLTAVQQYATGPGDAGGAGRTADGAARTGPFVGTHPAPPTPPTPPAAPSPPTAPMAPPPTGPAPWAASSTPTTATAPTGWSAGTTYPAAAQMRGGPDPAVPFSDPAFLAHPDPVGLYQPLAPGPATADVARSRSAGARRLRWISLCVLAIVLGGLGAADVLGAVIALPAYLAAALAVVGMTLIAATRFGRARGLLPVGLLLLVAVIGSTAASHLDHTRYPTRALNYVSTGGLPTAPVVMDSGTLAVDLRDLTVDRDVTYRAQLGVGTLQVQVPADTNVAVRYTVGKGVVSVYDEHVEAGVGLTRTLPPEPLLPGRPTLTLDLSVDVGHVEVRR